MEVSLVGPPGSHVSDRVTPFKAQRKVLRPAELSPEDVFLPSGRTKDELEV